MHQGEIQWTSAIAVAPARVGAVRQQMSNGAVACRWIEHVLNDGLQWALAGNRLDPVGIRAGGQQTMRALRLARPERFVQCRHSARATETRDTPDLPSGVPVRGKRAPRFDPVGSAFMVSIPHSSTV